MLLRIVVFGSASGAEFVEFTNLSCDLSMGIPRCGWHDCIVAVVTIIKQLLPQWKSEMEALLPQQAKLLSMGYVTGCQCLLSLLRSFKSFWGTAGVSQRLTAVPVVCLVVCSSSSGSTTGSVHWQALWPLALALPEVYARCSWCCLSGHDVRVSDGPLALPVPVA